MRHDEIVAEIQKRAADRGLLSHYCPDTRRCHGDRGFPDLVVAGPFGTLFLEVKTDGDTREPAQTRWMHQLLAGGEFYLEIHERHLADNDQLDQLLENIHLGWGAP